MTLSGDDYSTPWELLGEAVRRADDCMVVTDPWYRRRMDETLRLLPFPADAAFSLLDLGCGTGLYDFAIARTWPKATLLGIDINAAQVAYANDAARRLGLTGALSFEQGDVRQFSPVPLYNVVSLSEIVEHLTDPSPCLAAARRSLTDNGLLVASVPHSLVRRADWWCSRETGEDGQGGRESPSSSGDVNASCPITRFWHKEYTRAEIAQLLTDNGFTLRRALLCRFDVRRLKRSLPSCLHRCLRPFCDGRHTLKPAWDRAACCLWPGWAKTCLLAAVKT